jgi:hypothetical protein
MSDDFIGPKDYPAGHLVAGDVPDDFHKVLQARAAKDGGLIWDHLLNLANIGAECERMHGEKKEPRRRAR